MFVQWQPLWLLNECCIVYLFSFRVCKLMVYENELRSSSNIATSWVSSQRVVMWHCVLVMWHCTSPCCKYGVVGRGNGPVTGWCRVIGIHPTLTPCSYPTHYDMSLIRTRLSLNYTVPWSCYQNCNCCSAKVRFGPLVSVCIHLLHNSVAVHRPVANRCN